MHVYIFFIKCNHSSVYNKMYVIMNGFISPEHEVSCIASSFYWVTAELAETHAPCAWAIRFMVFVWRLPLKFFIERSKCCGLFNMVLWF